MSGNPPEVEFLIFEDFAPFYSDRCGWSWVDAEVKKEHVPNYRYLGAHGGRGSGKSYQLAKALIFNVLNSTVKALCLRQIDRTVDDSVKSLIDDIIVSHGLPGFISQAQRIFYPPTKSEIIFGGVRDRKAAIGRKSIHNLNIIWFEEAEAFTMDVLDIMGPCARGEKAQIWCSWNPFDEDAVFLKWFATQRANSYCIEFNYKDNPLFPKELEEERQNDLALVAAGLMTMDMYRHIWDGETLTNNPNGLCDGAAVNFCAENEINTEVALDRLERLEIKAGFKIDHLQRLVKPLMGRRAVGVDIGLQGDDPAVMVEVDEFKVVKWKSIPKCDGVGLFQAIQEFVEYNKEILINIDSSSEVTVYDLLKSAGYNVTGVKFGGKAKRNVHDKYSKNATHLYKNARHEMAFELRELVNHRLIQIPDDRMLKTQLRNYEYSTAIVNNQKILVLEKKDKYKARMKHSPDFFDALALAFYSPFVRALPGIV